MQLEVGSIIEGKVTGITKFGAFVELGEGTTGMVHISEVAPTYVKEIRDHLTDGQMIKVKILSVGEDGKISLSVKRAMDTPPPAPRRQNFQRQDGGRDYSRPKRGEPQTFEDMMSKFKQSSDEKMYDLKKFMDGKRGTSGRRGGSK